MWYGAIAFGATLTGADDKLIGDGDALTVTVKMNCLH